MELADKLYYSISELAAHFKVAPSLLRYWEAEFNSIKPKRNAKGTRFYTKKDIEEIAKIHQLVKVEGYTLQGAREQLKIKGDEVDRKIELTERLESLKEKLTDLRSRL